MKGHDLQPALKWAQEHRKELGATAQGCGLEFSLHRLQYLQVLKADGEPYHLMAGTQQHTSLAVLLMAHISSLPVSCRSAARHVWQRLAKALQHA